MNENRDSHLVRYLRKCNRPYLSYLARETNPNPVKVSLLFIGAMCVVGAVGVWWVWR